MKIYAIEFERTPAYSMMSFATETADVKAETEGKALERFISEMKVRGCSFDPPNKHWDKLERIISVKKYYHYLFEAEDQDFYLDDTMGGLRS
tara:strand:- start:199 stop:474 length:276 start_codon:yes stop_codon:yes gene_type:complete